ncbi:MAG TPA: outer membrane protein assembly factor BamD [Bacteroidia bacterium]|nr:outer membrane protein assembly factor BamD [Bacteroidia bacterium]
MAGRLFIAFSLIFALLAGGCNGFSKIQKSTDLNLKFTKAKEYYASGDYVKAQMLFDELYAVMRNTNNGEDVLFYLAYSNYKLGDYILAGYQFRVFYRSYPLSARAEECLYMSAYCHYLISPSYSLDQYDTYLAIDQFQYFVQMFPNSERVKECNKLIDALHEKLQKKQFEIAKMYLNISQYKAAITSFEILLHDYPDSKYREESMFLLIKAKYYLAVNSIEEKKEQRIKEALTQYNSFAAQFPESEFSGDAKTFYDKIIKLQNDFNEDKKSR